MHTPPLAMEADSGAGPDAHIPAIAPIPEEGARHLIMDDLCPACTTTLFAALRWRLDGRLRWWDELRVRAEQDAR